MLIIIWGSKGREKVAERGEFFCPLCRRATGYERKEVSRWFTLYFIPVFPLETVGEWVECDSCGGDFNTDVTKMSRAEIEATLAPWKCASCGNSNPSEYQECLSCGAVRPVAAGATGAATDSDRLGDQSAEAPQLEVPESDSKPMQPR